MFHLEASAQCGHCGRTYPGTNRVSGMAKREYAYRVGKRGIAYAGTRPA
jgi:hypothetical protein